MIRLCAHRTCVLTDVDIQALNFQTALIYIRSSLHFKIRIQIIITHKIWIHRIIKCIFIYLKTKKKVQYKF